jgi:hypothetical protein
MSEGLVCGGSRVLTLSTCSAGCASAPSHQRTATGQLAKLHGSRQRCGLVRYWITQILDRKGKRIYNLVSRSPLLPARQAQVAGPWAVVGGAVERWCRACTVRL